MRAGRGGVGGCRWVRRQGRRAGEGSQAELRANEDLVSSGSRGRRATEGFERLGEQPVGWPGSGRWPGREAEPEPRGRPRCRARRMRTWGLAGCAGEWEPLEACAAQPPEVPWGSGQSSPPVWPPHPTPGGAGSLADAPSAASWGPPSRQSGRRWGRGVTQPQEDTTRGRVHATARVSRGHCSVREACRRRPHALLEAASTQASPHGSGPWSGLGHGRPPWGDGGTAMGGTVSLCI